MILADDILAARGSINDAAGTITSVSNAIMTAQRFVLSNDVGVAAYNLIRTKPSSMIAAMPLCRLPYKTMWIEWNGNVSALAGWALYPEIERDKPKVVDRVEPIRMGCLIETLDDTRQRGQMTWAWLHPTTGINISPLSVNFDWTEDGDMESAAQAAGLDRAPAFNKMLYDRWIRRETNLSDEDVMRLMLTHSGWAPLINSKKEVAAVRELVRHEVIWISRHGHEIMKLVMRNDPQDIVRMLQAWEGDISGEAPFMSTFIMMLNSRNALEQSFSDLTKLNRSREKRGKPHFLDHHVTKLYMSKARMRSIAAGMAIGERRGTTVSGHFKIRRSGVWWWSDHWRGDITRPMPRDHYEAAGAQK